MLLKYFEKKKKKPSELKDVICAVIQLTVREIRPKTPTFDSVFCCPRNQCMFQLEPKYNTVQERVNIAGLTAKEKGCLQGQPLTESCALGWQIVSYADIKLALIDKDGSLCLKCPPKQRGLCFWESGIWYVLDRDGAYMTNPQYKFGALSL